MINVSHIIQEGNRIHLWSMQGIYTVLKLDKRGTMTITAGTWHGETKVVPSTDFKCFANENWVYNSYPLIKLGVQAILMQDECHSVYVIGPASILFRI